MVQLEFLLNPVEINCQFKHKNMDCRVVFWREKSHSETSHFCSCWESCGMFHPNSCEALTNYTISDKFISSLHRLVMRSWAWASNHWGSSEPARNHTGVTLASKAERLEVSAVCRRFVLINGVLSLQQKPGQGARLNAEQAECCVAQEWGMMGRDFTPRTEKSVWIDAIGSIQVSQLRDEYKLCYRHFETQVAFGVWIYKKQATGRWITRTLQLLML